MLTRHNIWNIVRKVSYIFAEWWLARSTINIRIILFLNDNLNVLLVLICIVYLVQHSKHCKKSFLYIRRMMIGALIHQHSYNTVINDKRNVALVLICNVDLLQHSFKIVNDKSNGVLVLCCNGDLAYHSKHCKKSFLYIWRMMIGALSHNHSYYTVSKGKSNGVLALSCNVDLVQHSNQCMKSFLYIRRMMIDALSNQHSHSTVLNDKT